jgi:hypothetical protein
VNVRELLMLTHPALVAAANAKGISKAAELFGMMISLGDKFGGSSAARARR